MIDKILKLLLKNFIDWFKVIKTIFRKFLSKIKKYHVINLEVALKIK